MTTDGRLIMTGTATTHTRERLQRSIPDPDNEVGWIIDPEAPVVHTLQIELSGKHAHGSLSVRVEEGEEAIEWAQFEGVYRVTLTPIDS